MMVPGVGCATNHGGYGNHDNQNGGFGGNARNPATGSYASQDIPFVPLQVSRKATKQTPKKSEEDEVKVEQSVAPAMGVEGNGSAPVAAAGRGRAREKSETPQREGRRKPRIAANFSLPPQ